jgi:hypothetical protein
MKQPQHTDEQDANEVARFGYQQELRRSLGAFSSFALAFSLTSISTGIFANFRHGFQQVGPGIVLFIGDVRATLARTVRPLVEN